MPSQMFWLKSTTTGIGQKCHLPQAVLSACLLSRDTGNARIKWYRFRLSSRHCAFKTVVKYIYLARKKWSWKSERCHVSTSNWEIRCGLYASLLLWSVTLTFSFPLPPSLLSSNLLSWKEWWKCKMVVSSRMSLPFGDLIGPTGPLNHFHQR